MLTSGRQLYLRGHPPGNLAAHPTRLKAAGSRLKDHHPSGRSSVELDWDLVVEVVVDVVVDRDQDDRLHKKPNAN
jgi:hypothetical protein